MSALNSYELAVILRADKEETEVKRDIEGLKAQLEKFAGCEVINLDPWNRRKLSYPIKKQTFGYYVIFDVAIDPAVLPQLRKELSLKENILRYLIVRKYQERKS